MKKRSDKLHNFALKAVFLLLLFALTASSALLSLRFDCGKTWVYFILNLLASACALVMICVDGNKHSSVWKCAFLLYFTAIIVNFCYYFTVRYDLLERFSDLENVRKIILSTGNFGIIVFFLLTVLEIVILPVPAAITIIVGTLIYGSLTSFIVSATATFLGSVIAFLIGRKLGKKLLYWLFDKQKIDKYAAFLGKKGKIPFIIMMLLPFFPDDVICMSAGMTDMSFGFFCVAVAITRTLYIFFVAFFGDGSIIPFSGWGIPVWVGIFAACIALSLLVNKFLDKKQPKTPQKE